MKGEMSMLAEIAASYYTPGHDLNCAEAIVYAANEAYQLNLSKETLRASAGFGGGMAVEETCGALTGAILILGVMLVQERAHESDRMKEVVAGFLQRYEKLKGTTNCQKLKDQYREEDPVKCRAVVMDAARLLEEVLGEEMFPVKRKGIL